METSIYFSRDIQDQQYCAEREIRSERKQQHSGSGAGLNFRGVYYLHFNSLKHIHMSREIQIRLQYQYFLKVIFLPIL